MTAVRSSSLPAAPPAPHPLSTSHPGGSQNPSAPPRKGHRGPLGARDVFHCGRRFLKVTLRGLRRTCSMHFEESTVPLSAEGRADPSAVTGSSPPTLSLFLFPSLFSFLLWSLLFLSPVHPSLHTPPHAPHDREEVASLFARRIFLLSLFSLLGSPGGTGWRPRE